LLNSAKATDRSASWQSLLDTTVPRAMYFCSWGLPLPTLDRNP